MTWTIHYYDTIDNSPVGPLQCETADNYEHWLRTHPYRRVLTAVRKPGEDERDNQ
jgi:hypothetical protein